MDFVQIEKNLLTTNRLVDLVILSRYLYSVGAPMIPDKRYDTYLSIVAQKDLAPELMSRTYDDDPVPVDLLKEFGLEEYGYSDTFEGEDMSYYDELNSDKSLSIKAVTGLREAWEFSKGVRTQRSILSLKTDGIFTKRKFVDKELKLALSRGRTGRAWPMTNQIVLVEPSEIDVPNDVTVYSEAFALPGSLAYLRNKYDKDKYKTPKSSAISMLRRKRDEEDYVHIECLTFGADGLGRSYSEIFKKCEELGFTTVPYLLVEPYECPEEFENFVSWLQSKLDTIWEMSVDYPSDGVVWDLDDKDAIAEVKGIYSSRNIALKLEQWSYDYYPGVVEEILDGHEYQNRVFKACKVKIKPFTTRDMTNARIINCYNPSILIANEIVVGSKLYFERNSGAVNVLIHGDKLKRLDLEVEN